MSSAHQIADNLKITRVFISLFSWIMLPSLHNIFPDQVNLTHYFCYSAIPAHLAILCYIKKLTSYILLGSLLAAFFHTPIACHNIQSFKRKQIQKRQEQEKNLRTNIMTELYPCIFHNHDNKK